MPETPTGFGSQGFVSRRFRSPARDFNLLFGTESTRDTPQLHTLDRTIIPVARKVCITRLINAGSQTI